MRYLKLLAVALLIPMMTATAKVLEDLAFKSTLMNQSIRYAVYLPPEYDSSNRRYPVLYLLHGYTDQEWGWIQFGEIPQIADRLTAESAIAPLIIVMPDGGVTWYMNDHGGKARFEDMIMQELLPFIDRTYRTRPSREYRAVAGLSMGGYGSLLWSLHNPHLFSRCVALSAAVYYEEDYLKMEQALWDKRFGDLLGPGLKGRDRLTAHLRRQMVPELVQTLPADSLKKIAWYIDCGDDDFLTIGNCRLHIALTEKGVPHEFRMRDGKHSWSYWRSGIVDGLKFLSEGFHR